MSGSITTSYSGGSASGIVPSQQNGETVEQWIDRHFDAALISAPSNTTNFLTRWTCEGEVLEEPTSRNPGESYRAFADRHRSDAEARMADCPPE